ncbi:CapA family protein [Candidatus Dependentiae bacterium]|nr:MAG: CapA family protein [Candidatus Dependentiae bacterium]
MIRLLPTHSTIKIVIFMTILSLVIIGKSMQNQKQSSPTIVIGLGGDTMLGRLVNDTINTKGYKYPWGNLLPYLQKTDLTILNLENTFTKSTKKVSKTFNFKADPDKVKTLQIAGIDVVNLANNHILDFDIEGLEETIKTLDNTDIYHVGAGSNLEKAHKAVVLTKNDIIIGIIGYTDNEPGWAAGPNKPGINYIHVGDIATVKNDIANIRNNVDLLIISIHWGPNMREKPSQQFISFAHQMIDAGVDIIHGHSAHIFQGIEIYKNKLILYDTGDFVDDYRVDPILRNDRSFFYKVIIDKKSIRQIQLIPTLISNMQVNLASGKDYQEIISRIQKLSAPFGTVINNKGTIELVK